MLALSLVAWPQVCYADEIELVSVESDQDYSQGNQEEEQGEVLQEEQVVEQEDKTEQVKEEILSPGEVAIIEGMANESQKIDEMSDKVEGVGELTEKVDKLTDQLQGMLESKEEQEPESEPVSLRAGAGVTFTAYANASTSSAYASYARQMLPKLSWLDHYCFLQDGQSSYVMVWGDLAEDDVIHGQECNWIRWYNAGVGVGWTYQAGSGTVTIDPGGYVVLSSVGSYPLLDDGTSLMRNEVGFYAVVAALLYSLRLVTSFLVRMRGAS